MTNQDDSNVGSSTQDSEINTVQKETFEPPQKASVFKRKSSLIIILVVILLLIGIGNIYLIIDKKSSTADSSANSNNVKIEEVISDEIKQEISQCEITHKNDYNKHNTIGDCISNVAFEHKNYSVCEEQKKYRTTKSDNGYAFSCIKDIAVSKDDINVCATLKDDTSEYYKNLCFTGIAKNRKDVSICDFITPDKWESAETCKTEFLLFLAKEDPSVCDKESNKARKFSCLESVSKFDAKKTLEIPLSQWNTYNNSEYGFSFKYPSNVKLIEFYENENVDKRYNKIMLRVASPDINFFNVEVRKPSDYELEDKSGGGRYQYIPEEKIWYDAEADINMCLSSENRTDIRMILNDKGYKVARLRMGDVCASSANYIAVTKSDLLIAIEMNQFCDSISEEGDLQKMIINSFEFTNISEDVCK